MKILFPYMARWFAVNWTRYHSLLTALAEKGHEIHVLQPPALKSDETNFQEIDEFHQENMIITDVKLNDAIWKTKFPFDKLVKKAYYSLKAYSFTRKYIKDKQIDVVLTYNIPQSKFTKINNVIHVFDYADDYIDMLSQELGSLDNFIIRAYAKRLLNNMMDRSDVVLSVSHELASLCEGNVHVIPNGVTEKIVTKENKITKDRPVIGFVGSFEYFIDFDIIINSAIILQEFDFHLIGTGRDFSMVKSKIQSSGINNIKLFGGVPHDEIFNYISDMDICLNIFKPIDVSHRACPIKLFEYMSMKKPVISTRLRELKYIDDGFLFYADTVDEFVNVARKIIREPDLSNNCSERGYNLTINEYTWEKIADKLTKIINDIKQ